MSEPFTLTVPADARYRVLAPEVAGRYVEMIGGSAADGQALAAVLTAELDKLAGGADDGGALHLSFHPGSGNVQVTVRCGTVSSVVRHPIPAAKG